MSARWQAEDRYMREACTVSLKLFETFWRNVTLPSWWLRPYF